MAFEPSNAALVDHIDDLLPQTQCRRCGEHNCRDYAAALASGTSPIDRCPPGGDETIAALAALLRVPILPLDASRGQTQPFSLARIDKITCIGCTLCIQACPVDAIVGAARMVHTVVDSQCTGCGLCLPPCPVDCIVMVPAGREWTRGDAERARAQFNVRHSLVSPGQVAAAAASSSAAERRAAIDAAFGRARSRRQNASVPR